MLAVLSGNTLASPTAATAARRARLATRPSAISPYLDVVRDRVAATEFTGKQIYNELALRGYTGSLNSLYDALEKLRQGQLPPAASGLQADEQATPGPTSKTFSGKRGAWWFIQAPDELSDLGRSQLALLQDHRPDQPNGLYPGPGLRQPLEDASGGRVSPA